MKKLIYVFIAILISQVMISCLNDKTYMDVTNTTPIIEFPQGGPGIVANALSVLPGTPDTDTAIALNIASPQVLNKNVIVTVRSNPSIIAKYNTDNGTNLEALPDSLFNIDSYQVTIPAGYRIGRIKIHLHFPKFDLSHNYAIALQIADGGGLTISGNYNTFFWSIGVRNQWDGIYSMKGVTLRSGDAARTGPFAPIEMPLITSGPRSVAFAKLQVWADGSGVGIGSPSITINSDNTVIITSPGGATNSSNQGLPYQSIYDPNSKTFFIQFTWGAGPSSRLATDTITYLRSR